MSRWLVNHATPAQIGPHGWDLAGFARHAEVALSMPRREGVVALRSRLQADRPLAHWTALPGQVLFWRPPGGLARVGLGQLARCPVDRLRLVSAASPLDWQVHPEDWRQVQRWQQQHVTSSWFAVQVGWPQQQAGAIYLPLSLWLPLLWLAEVPDARGWDAWWHADRSNPADALGQLHSVLQPPPPAILGKPAELVHRGDCRIEAALDALRTEVDLRKVVVGWPEQWRTTAPPWHWLDHLLGVRKWDYAVACRAVSEQPLVVCATPERLVAADESQIHALALAGTLLADQTPDDKLRTEHELVRDFVVQALQGAGVVQQKLDAFVRQAGPLQHLATAITAERPPGVSALQLALALHPTPALLGWPRRRSLEVATASAGGQTRSWYGGCAGVLAADGSGQGELAVLLRGAEATASQSDWLATAWAGAGLVAASHADAERDEIARKHRAIAQSMGWLDAP